jgi:hypothetical protein
VAAAPARARVQAQVPVQAQAQARVPAQEVRLPGVVRLIAMGVIPPHREALVPDRVRPAAGVVPAPAQVREQVLQVDRPAAPQDRTYR